MVIFCAICMFGCVCRCWETRSRGWIWWILRVPVILFISVSQIETHRRLLSFCHLSFVLVSKHLSLTCHTSLITHSLLVVLVEIITILQLYLLLVLSSIKASLIFFPEFVHVFVFFHRNT